MIRALCVAVLSLWLFSAALAEAQAPPYLHLGIRWLGSSPVPCVAPPGWGASRVFNPPKAPPNSADLCLYTWLGGGAPTPAQVAALFAGNGGAVGMTEDVPSVIPMNALRPWAASEVAFFAGLREAMRKHVGDASLLPAGLFPAHPAARIVVIDTAPDAPHGALQLGAGSRHGDNLARLIEGLVCTSQVAGGPQHCTAEVTTSLAMPWSSPGVMGVGGGHTGTLVDLAQAIQRAVAQWELDRANPALITPRRLILNLSLGWEDTPQLADCAADLTLPVALPARAVRQALQYAAARGALIIAAAGNDSGGPNPRTGLVCPGLYQKMPQQLEPSRPLLYAVSGVDFADRPLENARPAGRTGLVGLGLGGVAWSGLDEAPPVLIGSSVAAAVVTAVAAVTWAVKPSYSAAQVFEVVQGGGVAVPGNGEACPLSAQSCATRRANVCGALVAAGVATARCSPAPAQVDSSPPLPLEIATLVAEIQAPPGQSLPLAPPFSTVARFTTPSMAVAPWTFPTPISATCPTCFVASSSGGSLDWYFWLPGIGRALADPVLVLRLLDGSVHALALGALSGAQLNAGQTYVFPIPSLYAFLGIDSAYLTGTDVAKHYSVMEQIFVQR